MADDTEPAVHPPVNVEPAPDAVHWTVAPEAGIHASFQPAKPVKVGMVTSTAVPPSQEFVAVIMADLADNASLYESVAELASAAGSVNWNRSVL